MLPSPQSYYLTSSSNLPALRIALLLDSLSTVPAYAAKIIHDILASNFNQIAIVLVKKNGDAELQPSKAPWLYRRYLRVDARMKPENDPLKLVDCAQWLSSAQVIEVQPQSPPEFTSEILPKLRSRKLDVILQFGSAFFANDLCKTARFGVWRLQHADPEFYRGEPAHFWELRERNPISGVALQAVTAEAREPLVLARSLFATEETISVSRNRLIPYWGSAGLILEKLHELHEFGWDYVVDKSERIEYRGKRKQYDVASNSEMVSWLAPVIFKKAVNYPFRKPVVQHWRIGIRRSTAPLFEPESDCSGFRWIDPPKGHAWADPFLFEHEGKVRIFFEDYSYATKRGSIACAEIAADESWGPPIPCLEDPNCHYSYPHIFRDGAEIFMIPESYESNSVDLYRCTKFPNQWRREMTLLQGRFVDTTVWQSEGLWWLATTSADPVPGASSLWLYYSSSLGGDWKFHPRNPISRDIRSNRGAGRVFRCDKSLIRPSQSGAPTYGYSFTFNEITELSTARYVERAVKTIAPEHWKGMAGVHTYNSGAGFEVIDGRTPRALKTLL